MPSLLKHRGGSRRAAAAGGLQPQAPPQGKQAADRHTETLRLISLAQGPDRALASDAQAQLLTLHGGLVRSVLRRLVRPSTLDPDDLLQECRIALLRAFDHYDGAVGGFAPYADRCIFRAGVRLCDRHSRHAALPLCGEPASSTAEPAALALPDWALRLLTPLEARAVEGRIFEGRSFDDLSALLGLPACRLRQLYDWARARLRDAALAHGYTDPTRAAA